MKRRVCICLLVVSCSIAAQAQRPTITGYERGTLEFVGRSVSNFYTLEFATRASGPWTNWAFVTDAPITGAVMSLPSPMFFRIQTSDGIRNRIYVTDSAILTTPRSASIGSVLLTNADWGTISFESVLVPRYTSGIRGRAITSMRSVYYPYPMPMDYEVRLRVGDTTSSSYTCMPTQLSQKVQTDELSMPMDTNGWVELALEARAPTNTVNIYRIYGYGLSVYTANNELPSAMSFTKTTSYVVTTTSTTTTTVDSGG